MKMHLTTAFLASFAIASPAAAQSLEHSWSVSVKDGWLFPEQGLDLHDGLTLVLDYEVSNDGWYASVLRAQTDTRANDETDVCGGRRGDLAPRTRYNANVCMFELYGPEAYRVRGELTYELTENLSVTVTGDVVRGGFETDTARMRADWSGELFGPVSGSASAAVSVDTWSEDTVGQLSGGVSVPLVFGTTLELSYQRFDVLNEGRLDRSADKRGEDLSLAVSGSFSF